MAFMSRPPVWHRLLKGIGAGNRRPLIQRLPTGGHHQRNAFRLSID
jgi:hypothetical protein